MVADGLSAVQTWKFMEGEWLFGSDDDEENWGRAEYLAQMYALLGPPPEAFRKLGGNCAAFFDEKGEAAFDDPLPTFEVVCVRGRRGSADGMPAGEWCGPVPVPILESLEARESQLEDDEQEEFLRFRRSMLRWLPEERKTPRELLQDPWLRLQAEPKET